MKRPAWSRKLFGAAPSGPLPDVALRPRAAAAFAAELRFDQVTCNFQDVGVLRGVSLTIAPGEIVCLLGPSGSGKTTLLRIASGVDRPTSGRVLINGAVVAGDGAFLPPEKRSVGLMFQDFALFPHLTVVDNVAFGLKGLPARDAEREALSLLARVGLLHHARSYPHMLSGGEQQRAALARAIVPRPAVLLMDEPFSGLDVQLREAMQQETLKLLRETRATCLMVTHNPDEAMRLGDRIAVMRGGKILQVGRAEDLYREPADLFVARLFSEINELPMVVTGGRLTTPFGNFVEPLIAEGAKAVLCIRRRALRFAEPGENGVFGRVLATRFLGDAVAIDLGVTGIEQPLTMLTDEARARPRGTEVSVIVDPKGVLVFAADDLAS